MGGSEEEFPSPLGELYFLIKKTDNSRWSYVISVPSRGAIFLNLIKKMGAYFVLEHFRPLSGSYIS